MVAWYKHDIPDWMDGTESLSDGAYRAYHVICQLIYLHEGDITLNEHGIAGRCKQSVRAFRTNLQELLDAKKLTLVNGCLRNSRAESELEKVGENRENARTGGEKSGESRRNRNASDKSLKNKGHDEAPLPENRTEKTRLEETRQEQARASDASQAAPQPAAESKLKLVPPGPPPDFGQRIVKAFEDANSPNLPDTSRCGLWFAQGYDPEICIAIVREGIARKPSISNLKYFDAQIAEAHAVRDQPKAAAPSPADERAKLRTFWNMHKKGTWFSSWGPAPGMGGCVLTPELIDEFKREDGEAA